MHGSFWKGHTGDCDNKALPQGNFQWLLESTTSGWMMTICKGSVTDDRQEVQLHNYSNVCCRPSAQLKLHWHGAK